jgi:hypothetical protein
MAGFGPSFARKVGPRGVKNKDRSRGKSLSRLRIIATVNPEYLGAVLIDQNRPLAVFDAFS